MDINRIIAILADGKFHSGESLGENLGVSRAAVWKYISQIEALGLQVNSVKGRGYRLLNTIELLSGAAINAHLNTKASAIFPVIDIKSKVVSTNDEVKAGSGTAGPRVCLAEMQVGGRGRRGREWVSPYGANIYMSVAWEFPEMSSALDGLSLCVGIAVANAIERLGIKGVGLKWPNDLLFQQRKLAGILLEMEGELSGPVQVIMGIGVNVLMSREDGAEIDQDWVSLSEIGGREVSRNKLVAQILNELAEILPRFQRSGFVEFQKRWLELDAFIGKKVVLHTSRQAIEGCAKGVNAAGELLIQDESGVSPYRAGEVSLRVAK